MTNSLQPLARHLRKHSTPAECRLWRHLRNRQLGFKFRRQMPIGPHIVDFACCKARLIIEIDGPYHAHQETDVARDAALRALGWEVAHYWNDEVCQQLEDVLADIEQRLLAHC